MKSLIHNGLVKSFTSAVQSSSDALDTLPGWVGRQFTNNPVTSRIALGALYVAGAAALIEMSNKGPVEGLAYAALAFSLHMNLHKNNDHVRALDLAATGLLASYAVARGDFAFAALAGAVMIENASQNLIKDHKREDFNSDAAYKAAKAKETKWRRGLGAVTYGTAATVVAGGAAVATEPGALMKWDDLFLCFPLAFATYANIQSNMNTHVARGARLAANGSVLAWGGLNEALPIAIHGAAQLITIPAGMYIHDVKKMNENGNPLPMKDKLIAYKDLWLNKPQKNTAEETAPKPGA